MAFKLSLSPSPNPFRTKSPNLPFLPSQIPHPTLLRRPPRASMLSSDHQQEILEAVAESNEKLLPVVRTYENDSARLSLVGAVEFQQALTAAAADGGQAADEHLEAGVPAMVVETVFPGSADDHSTVSTRLFLPARKVKEKAKSLKPLLKGDILSNATSQNILAMTFRQVVLHQLWSFELVAFVPGSTRDMDKLEDPREVPASFTISSSDEMVISVLAEVICLSAMESINWQFHSNSFSRGPTNIFSWFQKPKRIVSKDSSVILSKFPGKDIVGNAKGSLENLRDERDKLRTTRIRSRSNWWTFLSSFPELEKVGGPEFIDLIGEYIPAYRLQMDTRKLDIKVEGGNMLAESYWEILLTHSQLVSLANALDMYYEDVYTLPGKQLSCRTTVKLSKLYKNKKTTNLLRFLPAVLASGLFVLVISILSKLKMPHLHIQSQNLQNNVSPQASVRCISLKSLEPNKLTALSISIIKRIKDSFCWPGEIKTQDDGYAWIGDLPLYLRGMVEMDSSCSDVASDIKLSEERYSGMEESAQNIASYQVVMSADGKVVGFQPTTQVAVNHWALNPLAKELYEGRKLSPGFIEPRLKISHPSEVMVFELLMSVNPESRFALVRSISNTEVVDEQ